MKKISIVSEKNELNNTYEIKTIVIFDDNKEPRIINYEGVQNLLAIVRFAEDNGFDVLGKDGIKPALNSGLVQIISKSNEKAMSELKAQIVAEQLKYSKDETIVENVRESEVAVNVFRKEKKFNNSKQ